MEASARGLTQAIRNANDGISLAQTADSAAGSISDILVRMRDLAMQASTGTLSDDDRALVQEEVTALISQIADVATRTTFNDNVLLNGSVSAGFDIQTGLAKIGRASCRERVCQDVSISVVAVSLKKK